MIQTILFDLDGTLLNTIDDLADASNWVCRQNHWPTFTVEQYKHMVGNGIPKLVERFSPEDCRSPRQLADTLAQFTARYDAHKEDKTAPYPGIPELLAALKEKGVQTAVFSNKRHHRPLLCSRLLCGGPGQPARGAGEARPHRRLQSDGAAGGQKGNHPLCGGQQRGHRHRPQRRPAGPGGRLGVPGR